MPGVDWIPGVSQLKSVVQAVTGDTEGAKQTLINFSRECPGVAQATSLVQLAAGDAEGAWETQKICVGTVNNIANGIPVVGHAKGVVHHIVGDHEGGNQALNAATRSAVVIGSGAAAGIATGGLGAIPAGIAAGATYDATATVITGEDQGYIAAFKNASENPSGGSIFDAVALPVGDGLAGYAGGQMANKMKLSSMEAANKAKIQSLEVARQAKLDTLHTIMDGPGTDGAAMQLGAEINQISSEINAIKHGTPQHWADVSSRNSAPMDGATKARIQVLEASLEAKTNTLTDMMGGPEPEAASIQLGNEIMQISREIDTIKHGKPQYWTDVKPKNAAPNAASASTSATVGVPVGYADQSTQEETVTERVISEDPRERDRQYTFIDEEDALYHESYVDSSITATNRQARRQTMQELDNRQAQKRIGEAHQNVGFSTPTELRSLLEQINDDREPNRNPNWRRRVEQLIRRCWLFLTMPTQFPYTLAVQLNNVSQGYYHSFIRHMDRWSEVISFDSTLINRLDPLRVQIKEYASADDDVSSTRARENFVRARQQLSHAAYNDIQTALADIQLSMHSFMQENMTYNNYIGRTISSNGQERLFFEVRTRSGERRIMVVCPSAQRYRPDVHSGDRRPLRLLITVFFQLPEEFRSNDILEGRE